MAWSRTLGYQATGLLPLFHWLICKKKKELHKNINLMKCSMVDLIGWYMDAMMCRPAEWQGTEGGWDIVKCTKAMVIFNFLGGLCPLARSYMAWWSVTIKFWVTAIGWYLNAMVFQGNLKFNDNKIGVNQASLFKFPISHSSTKLYRRSTGGVYTALYYYCVHCSVHVQHMQAFHRYRNFSMPAA